MRLKDAFIDNFQKIDFHFLRRYSTLAKNPKLIYARAKSI
jgi:hypothetical protein